MRQAKLKDCSKDHTKTDSDSSKHFSFLYKQKREGDRCLILAANELAKDL